MEQSAIWNTSKYSVTWIPDSNLVYSRFIFINIVLIDNSITYILVVLSDNLVVLVSCGLSGPYRQFYNTLFNRSRKKWCI